MNKKLFSLFPIETLLFLKKIEEISDLKMGLIFLEEQTKSYIKYTMVECLYKNKKDLKSIATYIKEGNLSRIKNYPYLISKITKIEFDKKGLFKDFHIIYFPNLKNIQMPKELKEKLQFLKSQLKAEYKETKHILHDTKKQYFLLKDKMWVNLLRGNSLNLFLLLVLFNQLKLKEEYFSVEYRVKLLIENTFNNLFKKEHYTTVKKEQAL